MGGRGRRSEMQGVTRGARWVGEIGRETCRWCQEEEDGWKRKAEGG